MKKVRVEIMGHTFTFRTWTYGMKQEALRKAVRFVPSRRDPDVLEPKIDPWVLNDQMLLQTLMEWDLKDEDGRPLPITLENIHRIEPPELVERMIEFTQRLNTVSEEERKKS
ncbi:hypothetical protein CW700_07755 [Candidatus Bathyarchaeota archaeon]|nr:MAG: hypothetical protein CW700_07755 [Candidatus Bathyarchaeota archaeon]